MQNKFMASCIFLLSVVASPSYASTDAFAAYIGGAWWQTEGHGNLKAPDYNGYNLSLPNSKQENNAFIFLTIENPNHFVPNFTITYGELQQNASGNFQLSTPALSTYPARGKIDLINVDTTAYFRPVSLSYFELDIGATLRILDGKLYSTITVSGIDGTGASDLSSVLPLLYANTTFIIPNTTAKFTINGNIGDSGKESTKDLSAAISYESAIGLGANLGYRYFKASINSTASVAGTNFHPDITADILIKGPYLGLFYHF